MCVCAGRGGQILWFGGWPVIMILQTVSNVLRLLSLHSGAPMTNQMTTPLKSRLGPPVSLWGSLTEHQ